MSGTFVCEAFGPRKRSLHPPKKCSSSVIVPRGWQQKCREKLASARFSIVSAPCGSGKSIAILLKCTDEVIVSNFQQKQLIVVPQRVIGQSFTEQLRVTNGHTYTWAPAHNFVDQNNTGVLQALKRWLLADAKYLRNPNPADQYKIEGVNAVCSHQALSIVWRGLTKAQRESALHKLTLSVDEAHHIRGVFDISNDGLTADEKEEANHLGLVIHAAVNSKDQSARVCLGTATFYRGDAGFILHKSVQGRFLSYTHSWVEHWPNLNLEYFRMEYRFYKGNPVEQAVAQIKADRTSIYLVYIPATGNAWRKKGSVKTLLDKIRAVVPEAQVLDLVTQHTQKQNTQRVRDAVVSIKNGSKPPFSVIVACGIGLEGMDYPPANKLLNLACQNSVTRAVQVIGRPMRKYAGKNSVYVYNYVSEFLRAKKGVTTADLLADRTNALLTCLAWDDFIHPVMITLPKVNGRRRKIELSEAVGHKYQSMMREILKAVELEEIKSLSVIKQCVADELLKHGVAEKAVVDGLVVRVVRALLKASKSTAAQNLSRFFDIGMLRKSGFNILKKYNLENQTLFFGDCSVAELKAVQERMRGNFEEWFAQAVAAKKDGLL